MNNISLEQLYQLIWSKPLATVAKHCQVSIPVMRQICLSQDIPVPWNSYRESNEPGPLPADKEFEINTAIQQNAV